jgi:amidohydrolase
MMIEDALSHVSDEETRELIRLRRDFHRHPELGYEELRTSGIIAERMAHLGYEVRRGVAKTGVLAQRGERGRTLLLRADMDALPIRELNDVEYRSQKAGVMHACGHDGHVAIALMAASRLSQAPSPGRIRFAFQPAEEGGCGADRMIEEGALDDVDAALGLHLWSYLPLGTIAVTAGPTMASVDEFNIEVRGKGCHAAMPHEGEDPIVAAAVLIQELQTIISRGISPLESAVVSVTKIEAGSAYNVIPETARLAGTIRTFSEDVRQKIHARMREIVGERGELTIEKKTRVLINDPRMCAIVRRAGADLVGEENIVEARTMGGEDFASILAKVPGCFFFVGAATSADAEPHHSPRFDIDERALAIGLEVLTASAKAYLDGGFGG